MSLSKEQIDRVVFSKYLLTQAKQHKDKAVPTSSFSILILHDLVEIILAVGTEIHAPQFSKPSTKILEALTIELNKVLIEKGTPINIQVIKRLNERRNGLKHATIFVNKMDVQNLYSETETFFIDFSKILFDLDYDRISLASLVSIDKVREHLLESEDYLKDNKYTEAIISITKSYHYFEQSELKVKGVIGYLGFSTDYMRDFSTRSINLGTARPDANLSRLATKVGKDITKLDNRITEIERVISLDVDYNSFRKFKQLLPHFYLPNTADKDDKLNFSEISLDRLAQFSYTEDQVKFCYDFVINACLKVANL
jgi:hypothetical protein